MTNRRPYPWGRARGVRRAVVSAVSATMTAGMMAVPVSAATAAPAPETPASSKQMRAATEAEAVRLAVSSGRQVEVASATTAFDRVIALPSGGLRMESAVVPQRVQRVDGSWEDIDLNLVEDGEGLLRPTASTADVRLSPGGNGPLVTMVRRGKTFSLAWPEELPPAVVSGDSATYPEVYPGADLVVRVTETGFAHVLVLKSAQAAARPEVREISLTVGGDAELVQGPDGGLRATADGEVLAQAPAPEMWDSRVGPSEGKGRSLPAAADRSTAAAPGDRAKIAKVASQAKGRKLVLRPSASMLSSPETIYPIFIDPAWSTGKSRWAYATSNNSTNTDTTRARVGYSPDTGVRYRSYFDFPLKALGGKHVYKAHVQMKLDHSWSCGDTWTHMYHTSGIVSTMRTKWAPSHTKWLASAPSHANEGGGCSGPPQTDVLVNFENDNVTQVIQRHAKHGQTNITIGFCACNEDGEHESSQDRWKKWYPNGAKLIVDYNNYPGKPTNLQVAGVACSTGQRAVVGSSNPKFSAIFPDGDSEQNLTTQYEWLEIPSSGTYNDSTPRKSAPAGASVPAGGRSTTAAVSAPTGRSYAFRALATDPLPYRQTSPWSDWCEFTVDTSVPNVTVEVVALPAGPGKEGQFTLTSTSTTVTKFSWGWTSPPTNEVSATTVGSLKTATVKAIAPGYGTNIFHVQAINAAGSRGDGSVEFMVDRPAPPVARWLLETDPDTNMVGALEDRQKTAAGDTPLVANDVTWIDDVRRIGAETPFFNNTTSHLQTTTPVLDTTKSFSVAAWVRMSFYGWATAVSQDGSSMSSFRLGYRTSDNKWCFTFREGDAITHGFKHACASTPVVLDQWTHLAGSYDATAKKLILYVNGVWAAETAFAGAWQANGPLAVGRALENGAPADQWQGEIADVQVFDRVLVRQDFAGYVAPDKESGGVDEPGMLAVNEAGRWNFGDGALECYLQDGKDTCEVADESRFDRWIATSRGTAFGYRNGAGAMFLDRDYYSEPGEPSTLEYGRTATKAGIDNSGPDALTVWQNTPVLRTDQSFTISAWGLPDQIAGPNGTLVSQQGTSQSSFYLGTRAFAADNGAQRWSFSLVSPDGNGTTTWTHAVSKNVLTADNLGSWAHLTAVYDAEAGKLRLYVNGELQQESSTTPSWHASGPLTVGAARWSPTGGASSLTDYWQGGVDDVYAFQGAMTHAQVKQLFESQASDAIETDE